MSSSEDKFIRIPEDIEFLLDICRNLLKIIKESNPSKEMPFNIEQYKRLRRIEKIYTRS